LLTGQTIDAKTALEYGMVNEVMPRDKLLLRAWRLADHIMTQPWRMTTRIVRRSCRRQITDSLDGGFAIQMFAHLAKKKGVHGREHIGSVVDYVRRAKRTASIDAAAQ
jgi:enoyl-CoA hydratase/carnithine racemase